MNQHDKKYKKIFGAKRKTWQQKLKEAEEYANEQIKYRIEFRHFKKFILAEGLFNKVIKLN